MTNMTVKKERKGKGLLYLIATAVLISIVFTACSDKPTGMADFVPEAPEVGTLPNPDSGTSITPPEPEGSGSSPKAWNECANLLQLYNNGYTYYESSERDANGKFKYTVEIKNKNQEVYFAGKDANGNDISRTYGLSSGIKKNYVSSEGAAFRFGSENNLSEKVIEFKPHNMQNYIKFSLAKKSSELENI